MNLLLTSAGLTNQSIINSLVKLNGKPLKDSTLVFIPTAANVEEGDKSWMINDLVNCQKQNFAKIDIIDFTVLPKDNWLPRFKQADILLFGGGNTAYLMDSIRKAGLDKILPDLLKTRVYVGISGGSMIASKKLDIGKYETLYSEKTEEWKNDQGLSFVDFKILPHLNSIWFPNLNEENLQNLTSNVGAQTFARLPQQSKIYALDDNSAIEVCESQISIISEGKYLELN